MLWKATLVLGHVEARSSAFPRLPFVQKNRDGEIIIAAQARKPAEVFLRPDLFACLPALPLIDLEHRNELFRIERADAGQESRQVGSLPRGPEFAKFVGGFGHIL